MPRNRTRSSFLALTLAALVPASAAQAMADTLHVSPGGSDANSCTPSLPCREIRRALTLVGPGDTILVADGSYKGFDVADVHGASGSPLVIKAQGGSALIQKTTDRSDNRDTIFITFSSYVVVDGLRSFNANRAALRVDQSPNITVRNCVFGNNATWGIFTDFSDDLLIENNETYGSVAEHGIYVSNSGDRPIVRGNRSHGNRAAGIHMNGDVFSGGDGTITGALIENNVIYDNGAGGAAGINMDGVLGSTIRNNLLYNNHASGITLYRIDGAEGPRGNNVLHNTIHQASDGRYALLLWQTSGTNTVRNNILHHPNAARGGITYETSSDVDNTDSDYNVLDRITPDDGGTVYSLAQWKALGHEPHSFSASPAALFVNAAGGDYRLAGASPAIDRGQTQLTVTRDIEGNARPVGPASDVGAYEANGAPAPLLHVTPTSLSFGSVNVGSIADQTVTVRNAGGGTLAGSASTSSPFSIVGGASYSLSANQSTTLTVRFSPTSAGIASRTLSLTGGGGGSVALGGTGLAVTPVLSVAPTSLSFGSVNVGSSSNLTVTLRNTGAGTLAGSASTTAPFSVVGTASYSLATNQSTTVTVRFSPASAGSASRSLTLTGGGGGSVGLTGTGVAPGAQAVVWTDAAGVAVSGNSLAKTVVNGWYNAGAVSTRALASGDGYVEFTAGETTTHRMFGLSKGNANFSYGEIAFAIYLASAARLHVYEKGVFRGSFGGYAAGDRLRVSVTGGVVRYWRNGAVFYTSSVAPAYPLLVDTSLHTTSATVINATLSGNWSASGQAIVWTSAAGVSVSGNTLTKTSVNGWGNAGAVSTKSLGSGDGFVELTARETTTHRMLGLSKGNTNLAFGEIAFGLYLAAGATLHVYEKGAYRGGFGAYAAGDRLRVSVTGRVVRYSRNGIIFYTSTVAPAYPLLVDTALYTTGATLANVTVSARFQ